MEAVPGRRAAWVAVLPFTFPFRWSRGGTMAKPSKILLVEDDPYDVELTLSALTENHLTNEIVVARDGAEALDYLYRRGIYQSREAGNPAVILLDLKLPKVDGLEVLKRIRAAPELKTVPVV